MVRVEFLGPIEQEPQEFAVSNLLELSQKLKEDATLHPWLECSAVAVNDILVAQKDFPLKSGDKVVLLPPVCGG